MTEQEQWNGLFSYAGILKAQYGSNPLAVGVKGRFISVLVGKLVDFWERHQDTLIPVLSQLAIAAIQALAASRASFDQLNEPGPR